MRGDRWRGARCGIRAGASDEAFIALHRAPAVRDAAGMDATDGYTLRAATHADIPRIAALIRISGIELSRGFYTQAQAAALTEHVFGVDTRLVEDGTYYVIERADALAACGGWSLRRTLFGGDQAKRGDDPLLNPAAEPSRIRAFFVAPAHARRGLGTRLIHACEQAARRAGFASIELASTMPGVPLYASAGYEVVERFDVELPGGVRAPLARMAKRLVG